MAAKKEIKNILIVDDNQDLADGLSDMLECEDYQTSVCYSGEEALNEIRVQDFDIVLLDAKLPGIGGIEVFYQIRKLQPGVKVIIVTAHRIDKLISEAIDNKSVQILHKSFSNNELLRQLKFIGKGILLVEYDESLFVDYIERLLQEHTYKPLVATSKTEAIEKSTTSEPDVLILDLKLPPESVT